MHTVDSRQLGMATGFAIEAAAEAIAAGARAADAAEVARKRAMATTSLFYVDTLEYLRRGGRVGAAAALVGSALAVKPLLQIEDGRIVPLEKVRTSAKALVRLEELAVEIAGDRRVDVAVAHLGDPDRAESSPSRLQERIAGLEPAGGLPGRCRDRRPRRSRHAGRRRVTPGLSRVPRLTARSTVAAPHERGATNGMVDLAHCRDCSRAGIVCGFMVACRAIGTE